MIELLSKNPSVLNLCSNLASRLHPIEQIPDGLLSNSNNKIALRTGPDILVMEAVQQPLRKGNPYGNHN